MTTPSRADQRYQVAKNGLLSFMGRDKVLYNLEGGIRAILSALSAFEAENPIVLTDAQRNELYQLLWNHRLDERVDLAFALCCKFITAANAGDQGAQVGVGNNQTEGDLTQREERKVELTQEPTLPEMSCIDDNYFHEPHYNDDQWIVGPATTPAQLRAIADHMEYRERQDKTPKVTDAMVVAAIKAEMKSENVVFGIATFENMRRAIAAALDTQSRGGG